MMGTVFYILGGRNYRTVVYVGQVPLASQGDKVRHRFCRHLSGEIVPEIRIRRIHLDDRVRLPEAHRQNASPQLRPLFRPPS